MAKKIKILYFMNVDWGWIKQRPHFLAEKLAEENDVVIAYPFSWRRRRLSGNNGNNLKLIPLISFPWSRKFRIIYFFNHIIGKLTGFTLIKLFKPDIIWHSSPEIYNLHRFEGKFKLIYDCMDDIQEFDNTKKVKIDLLQFENNLIENSDFIFCSSEKIRDILIKRTNKNKFLVINNAFSKAINKFNKNNHLSVIKKKSYTMGYFGTISTWFDFNIILSVIKSYPAINILLVGPIDNLNIQVPNHRNIKYMGPVKHEELSMLSREIDVFIMPFKNNDLVKSVDPVKLYEYIYFNKPIISIKYDGLEKFSKFVDFYADENDILSIINKMINNKFKKRYSAIERENFLSSNTWDERVKEIMKILNQNSVN